MPAQTAANRNHSLASLLGDIILSVACLVILWPSQSFASRSLTVPVSIVPAEIQHKGFPTFVMKWDEGGQPNPLALRWGRSQVPVREAGRGSIQRAFDFAVERLSQSTRPTGVLSLYATFAGPFGTDGSSAEAALSIGFLALLNGDPLLKGITITGTLESNGSIGQVSQIAEKTMAEAQAGYRMLLVPRGQFYAPRVNRVAFNLESNVWVREVDTIEEAYEIMTGKKL